MLISYYLISNNYLNFIKITIYIITKKKEFLLIYNKLKFNEFSHFKKI